MPQKFLQKAWKTLVTLDKPELKLLIICQELTTADKVALHISGHLGRRFGRPDPRQHLSWPDRRAMQKQWCASVTDVFFPEESLVFFQHENGLTGIRYQRTWATAMFASCVCFLRALLGGAGMQYHAVLPEDPSGAATQDFCFYASAEEALWQSFRYSAKEYHGDRLGSTVPSRAQTERGGAHIRSFSLRASVRVLSDPQVLTFVLKVEVDQNAGTRSGFQVFNVQENVRALLTRSFRKKVAVKSHFYFPDAKLLTLIAWASTRGRQEKIDLFSYGDVWITTCSLPITGSLSGSVMLQCSGWTPAAKILQSIDTAELDSYIRAAEGGLADAGRRLASLRRCKAELEPEHSPDDAPPKKMKTKAMPKDLTSPP
eukprot:s29_g72.t1